MYSNSISSHSVRLRFDTNNKYVVKKTIDLKGDTLYLPHNSTLVFKGGIIRSGVIVGDNSKIQGEKKQLFHDVKIIGLWNNDVVFSEWLNFSTQARFDNRLNFLNLMALSKGNMHTDVYLERGVFWTSTRSKGYAIRIPSNTSFHCMATIKEIPNGYKEASLIKIDKAENVVIDGGTYYGDLMDHDGEIGEWSHGIECRASSNVTIKNVVCREFWGDGIDVIDGYDKAQKPTLNCYNVLIKNAKCFYNRRTGIGLEAVIGCKVMKCVCRYSGQKRGTLPMAGIGIEAWNKTNEKIKNVEIIDCQFTDSKDMDLHVYANGPLRDNFGQYINNINIKNCTIGYFFVSYTNGITLDNCVIEKSKGYEHEYVKGLQYKNCLLKKKLLNKKITNLPNKKKK